MKTTYKYQIFVYRDGGLKFYSQEIHFGVARETAFYVDRTHSVTFVIRIPDRSPVSPNYAPRCWRVTGCAYKDLEPCSVVDIFTWI